MNYTYVDQTVFYQESRDSTITFRPCVVPRGTVDSAAVLSASSANVFFSNLAYLARFSRSLLVALQ